jgi:hypothetical protein
VAVSLTTIKEEIDFDVPLLVIWYILQWQESFCVCYLLLRNYIVLDERWEVLLSKVMPDPSKSPN